MKKTPTAIPEAFMAIPDYIPEHEINDTTFVLNYKKLLERYLSHGKPSEDTLRNYYSSIDNYLEWCRYNKRHPLRITEYEFTYYRDMLIRLKMKKSSIKSKLNAVKQFYNAALKLKLISDNPAKDIGIKAYEPNDISPLKFLKLEQLKYLLAKIPDDNEDAVRDKTIVMLMALEGLRTIEVYRMSTTDIDWKIKTIYIHGKGHNDFIYPRDDVLKYLYKYIQQRYVDKNKYDKLGEPIFTSLSNRNKGGRMDRRNIRRNIDKWLSLAGFKKAGISCHMLRHTCGTLLYSKTKDLQVVKQVLRHSDVNITSKYAHVFSQMDNRYTSDINLNNK
ncbi:tyrosine-type recombinase/integrase [Pectinatus sottacetonis]|uniref:tyrosine-type recombinase/integrase n=1 Tax=Pectinatus sottacetonis TaxID=1002795 RepID=UPI001E5C10DE|nr:tyrosine-type recombinase/integrase [Pectinatus sottacetonis]